jgi:hypothetical protein
MTERDQIRADIKRQLNSYRDLRAEHQQLLQELERLEALIASPSGPNMDGMPRSPGVSDPVQSLAIKLLTLKERYQAQIEKLASAQIKIENMIEGLEPTERLLARYRYIDGLKWETVCDMIHYSWRQTHRLHGQMINKLVTAEIEKE